jgi:PIN domain nuclease of toxin-antitoxin system
VRLLLDTHVLLWWATASTRLDADLRDVIDDGANDVHLSAVTTAEIAVKSSVGKLEFPHDLVGTAPGSGFTELPLTSRHAAVLAELPLLHRDPFDRMLIAQARVEGLTFVTVDPRCRAYDVPVLPPR